MHLVRLLLPLYDNEGQRFPPRLLDGVFDELTHQFGGVTAYQRSPAEGAWKPPNWCVFWKNIWGICARRFPTRTRHSSKRGCARRKASSRMS